MKRNLTPPLIWILVFSMFSILTLHMISPVQATVFFQSGFESGTYTDWTGEQKSDGALLNISSSVQHHGDYANNLTLPSNKSGPWALNYKTLDSGKLESYGRCYVKLQTLYTELGQTGRVGPSFRDAFGSGIAWSILAYNLSGRWWGISYWQGGAYKNIWTAFALQADIWYCVELYCKISNDQGVIQLWIDGNLQINATGLDTNDRNEIRQFTVIHYFSLPEPDTRMLYVDDCLVSDGYVGPETPPSIGEFSAPSTVYANQYFCLNATINIGNTIFPTDFSNASVQVGDNIVLKWRNDTNTFSESADPFDQATLNESACLRSTKNSTSYKLTWCLRLNNYPSGDVDLVGKVFDSGGFVGSNSETDLFSFVSHLSVSVQARDADGVNVSRQVFFNGSMANGTSFTLNSDLYGYATASVCYGTTTIYTWWGTHLIQITTEVITNDTALNIDTYIKRLASGSNYLLFSLNQTVLPSPTLIGTHDWRIEDVIAEGTIEFKMDNKNWIRTSEPYSFTIDADTFHSGWSFLDNIFTFPIQFSSLRTFSMTWEPEYTINITATEGGTTNPIPGTYLYLNATEISVSAEPNENYLFDYWEVNGTGIGSVNPVILTMNATYNLHAVFSVINRTLNITATTGGTTDPIPSIYQFTNGTIINVTATPTAGYNFSHWELDGVHSGALNMITVVMDADHTLHAVFNASVIRDIAVTNITYSKTIVSQSFNLNVNVTVKNKGDTTETFNLTLYAESLIIETQTVTLQSNESATITYIWNTTSFDLGNYTVKAYAEPVPGETETTDNLYIGNVIRICIIGDIDADGKVDMKDVGYVALRFGSVPTSILWDPNADIDGDNVVNMYDVGTVARNFGELAP